ncbi:hypothetical protein FHG87_004101 [Trinorchestia longiramus]|nr:hypothetical protein FHG87_004101 [Trinorchestia longiramus]
MKLTSAKIFGNEVRPEGSFKASNPASHCFAPAGNRWNRPGCKVQWTSPSQCNDTTTLEIVVLERRDSIWEHLQPLTNQAYGLTFSIARQLQEAPQTLNKHLPEREREKEKGREIENERENKKDRKWEKQNEKKREKGEKENKEIKSVRDGKNES